MWIDLTVPVTAEMHREAAGNEAKASFGHLGTHFDVMDKTFSLELLRCPGVVFDVRGLEEITAGDFPLEAVAPGQFVQFFTGWMDRHRYGTGEYFTGHPVLAPELLDTLLERKVALIGIDSPGVRRGREHVAADQRCADRGVFIIENLTNLELLLGGASHRSFTVYTFPLSYEGMSGLPCRVVAQVD